MQQDQIAYEIDRLDRVIIQYKAIQQKRGLSEWEWQTLETAMNDKRELLKRIGE
jgi:hypothetical protein